MEQIKSEYLNCEKNMKIYIYNIYPDKFSSLKDFIKYALNDPKYKHKETYKAYLYIMNFIYKSNFYTDNYKKADLFLAPQWENYHKSRNYEDDLIKPLYEVINSDMYKKTGPNRNHIFIYSYDHTPYGDKNIPVILREHLMKRFIRITFSGRIYNFGRFHLNKKPKFNNYNINHETFNFNYLDEIVIPCGIPIKYDISLKPSRLKNYDFYYKNVNDIDPCQEERNNFLKYIESESNLIIDNISCYFGIYCSGYGIWTARLINYLKMSIIPIIPSDGIILPFERFFNYESFTVKLLSDYKNKKKSPIKYLEKICSMARNYDKEARNFWYMQKNCYEISQWLDWNSKDILKNPYTLTMIELYDYVLLNRNIIKKIPEKSYVAKKEYYKIIEGKLPKPYRYFEYNIQEKNNNDTNPKQEEYINKQKSQKKNTPEIIKNFLKKKNKLINIKELKIYNSVKNKYKLN